MVLAGLALCPALVFATATVSGNLQDAGGSAVNSRTFVRFWLRGCANNQPRVNGVALIVPPGGPGYYKDFAPDAAGAISGSIYKNSEIECNGATGNTWYGVQVYRDGKPGPETPYSVVGATFNLNTAAPTVQNPPPPPATFPYIMANPIAAQTISNFPLIFGNGSGISANYQGVVRAAGTYLRSDGLSFFAPVSSAQITNDIVASPNLNGLVYWTGSGLSTTQTGGAGTLCLVSTSGGVPAFSSCAGSSSTAWSALSAPSGNLALNMAQRTTAFTWGTGTGSNPLFTLDGSSGNGGGVALKLKGQTGANIFQLEDSAGSTVLAVGRTGTTFNWGTGTAANPLLTLDSSGGDGTGPILKLLPSVTAVQAIVIGVNSAVNCNVCLRVGDIIGWRNTAGNGDVAIAMGAGDTILLGGAGGVMLPGSSFGLSKIAAGDGLSSGFPGNQLLLKAGNGGPNGAKGGDTLIVGGDGAVFNGDGGGVFMRSGIPDGVGQIGRVKVFDVGDNTKEVIFKPEVLPTGTTAAVGQGLTGTASLNFTSIAANACSALTISVPGAADGDAVSLGIPNVLASTASLSFTGFVSAANTVTVRACNVATGASADPAAATVRAVVWKF